MAGSDTTFIEIRPGETEQNIISMLEKHAEELYGPEEGRNLWIFDYVSRIVEYNNIQYANIGWMGSGSEFTGLMDRIWEIEKRRILEEDKQVYRLHEGPYSAHKPVSIAKSNVRILATKVPGELIRYVEHED